MPPQVNEVKRLSQTLPERQHFSGNSNWPLPTQLNANAQNFVPTVSTSNFTNFSGSFPVQHQTAVNTAVNQNLANHGVHPPVNFQNQTGFSGNPYTVAQTTQSYTTPISFPQQQGQMDL